MRGTITPMNKASIRPLLIAGVEKRFVMVNALLSFLLVAGTHFHLPACLIGVGFFIVMHILLAMMNRGDPHLGQVLKRASRYAWRSYYPAKSHPLLLDLWVIKTVSRPW